MSFGMLPDELVAAIIDEVPSIDLATGVPLTNRRLNRIANDARLWLRRCIDDYACWTAESRALIRQGENDWRYDPVWKRMWLQRWRADKETECTFEALLTSQAGRMQRLNEICARRQDAREYLLRQYCRANAEAQAEWERQEAETEAEAETETDTNTDAEADAADEAAPDTDDLPAPHAQPTRPSAYQYRRAQAMQDERTGQPEPETEETEETEAEPAPPRAKDYLARRYYAELALASIYRSEAIDVWCQVRHSTSPYAGLIEALSAFDLFALHDGDADVDNVRHMLERLASGFMQDHKAHMAGWTVRTCALALARYLRMLGVVGMAHPDRNYRRLRNCLMGHALADSPEHPSLPLVSSAIYVGVAQLVGLPAFCCSIPGHVYVTVLGLPNQTVDDTALPGPGTPNNGQPLTAPLPENDERMFLDPYATADEVPMAEIRARVREVAFSTVDRDTYLLPTPTRVLVQRLALNVEAAHAYAVVLRDGDVTAHLALRRTLTLRDGRREQAIVAARHASGGNGDALTDAENCVYGAAWATLLMLPTDGGDWMACYERLVNQYLRCYHEDTWILERYLTPLQTAYMARAAARHDWTWRTVWMSRVSTLIETIRRYGQRAPQPSRRYTQSIQASVTFRVGQVMRHRRYGFVGIIDGWTVDPKGRLLGQMLRPDVDADEAAEAAETAEASAEASSSSAEASSSPPKNGAFYSCLRANHEWQVVAQHNVEIVTDASLIPPELMYLAGKHFLSFDRASCTFQSNVRECFPDD